MKTINNDHLYDQSRKDDFNRQFFYEASGFDIEAIKSVISFGFDTTSYIADTIKFELTSKQLDEDYRTFRKYKNGENNEWTLKFTAIFDGGSQNSLHSFLWDNVGEKTTFMIRPFAEISETYKYYLGEARIPYRPGFKSKVGKAMTFNYEMKIIGQPTKSSNILSVYTDVYSDFY